MPAGQERRRRRPRHDDRTRPVTSTFPSGDEPNPFLRYRSLFHSYHVARAHGLSDADYVEVVERLDAAIARVDGRGFAVTPFGRSGPLSDHLKFARDGGPGRPLSEVFREC